MTSALSCYKHDEKLLCLKIAETSDSVIKRLCFSCAVWTDGFFGFCFIYFHFFGLLLLV